MTVETISKSEDKTLANSLKTSSRKSVVADFFRLVAEGRPKDGLKHFSPDCVQHNPYVRGDVDVLLDSMMAAMKEMSPQVTQPDFRLRHVLEEGDVVAVYTQLLYDRSKPEAGGLRQVHLFRFRGDKIIEYWDITQSIDAQMPNAAGAF